jgi:hypothetical protein
MNPASSLFLSLCAGAGVALIGFFSTGLHRRQQLLAPAGLQALNRLKWREFADSCAQLFRQRGFTLANHDRKPGDGGFDLLLEREGERHLVQIKESAAYTVDADDLVALSQVMHTQGARGAFLVCTGRVSPAIALEARRARIQIIHGDALWREIQDFLPQGVIHEARIDSQLAWRKRLLSVGAAGVLAALVVFVGSILVLRLAPAPAPTAGGPAAPRDDGAAPGLSSEDSAASESLAPIPSRYSPTELETRRQEAASLIGGVENVASVGWSTKSTLVIGLNGGTKPKRDQIIGEVCKRLLTFDELRLTRLQIHEFEPATAEDARVHWQQCR